jgi:hypothetical protein
MLVWVRLRVCLTDHEFGHKRARWAPVGTTVGVRPSSLFTTARAGPRSTASLNDVRAFVCHSQLRGLLSTLGTGWHVRRLPVRDCGAIIGGILCAAPEAVNPHSATPHSCLRHAAAVATGVALLIALTVSGCDTRTDNDGDGVAAPDDCDDNDPRVFPWAHDPDPCDDENLSCSTVICDDWGNPYENDQDRDGFSPPLDCDDSDPSVYRGARDPDPCDSVDENCDALESHCKALDAGTDPDEDAGTQ